MQGLWWHGIFSLIPALAVGLLFILFFSQVFRRSSNHAEQVEIGDSKMVYGKYDGNLTVSVIGMLKNTTDLPLEDLQLEAQFFDKAGDLLDVGTHNGYGETIPPSGEAAFKIQVYATHPVEEYASFRVFLRSAKDATAFP